MLMLTTLRHIVTNANDTAVYDIYTQGEPFIHSEEPPEEQTPDH